MTSTLTRRLATAVTSFAVAAAGAGILASAASAQPNDPERTGRQVLKMESRGIDWTNGSPFIWTIYTTPSGGQLMVCQSTAEGHPTIPCP